MKLSSCMNGGIKTKGSSKGSSRRSHLVKYNMKSIFKRFCQICGCRATQQFCGILICDSCKNFYRHSVVKGRVYKCSGTDEHSCIVSFKSEAITCQSCHLKKCQTNGMSKLALKFYRQPTIRQLPIKSPKLVKKLTKIYFRLFRSYERKVRSNIKPLLLSDSALERPTLSYKADMFSQLCSYYQPLVDRLVEFSKLLPGFADLPPDDRLILLKTGFIDVWLILNAQRLTHVQDSITLFDGTQVPVCEMTTIYTKDYVTSLMELSDECRSLKLLPSDKALLIAIALACPDRPNLIAADQVKQLRSNLISSLTQFLQLTRATSTEICNKVTTLLSTIYDIGKQHALLLNVYRAEVELLTVTPVITELFDLHPSQAYKES